jgi:type VI secretion system secreted protein VgrG
MTGTPSVEIRIESHGEPWAHVRVQKLSGREIIGQLFTFDVDVVCDRDHELPEGVAAGEEISIVISLGGDDVRQVHGILESVRSRVSADDDGHASHALRVVPRAARLALVETQEIYLDRSIPDILKSKLERHGLGSDVEMRLRGTYPAREIVVQYRESDLAFVSRLAEHAGISFFFEHEDGRDRIVFTDHAEGFSLAQEIPFRGRGEKRGVFAIERVSALVPTAYIVQDYNYRQPDLDLSAAFDLASGNGGGVVEHGPHVKSPEEAEALARVRAEERRAQQLVLEGRSGALALTAGHRTTLVDAPRVLASKEELLLVEITHEATIAVFGAERADAPNMYANTFRAVPTDFTYRPPRRTPRPSLPSVVTGVIQPGPDGETGGVARIDSDGRYTVQLHFDTALPGEQKASHPMRMAQPFAGPSYGMHFPLRRGTEVLVAFVNGDPDRPVIIGGLYNATSPNPVVSANANKHQIKAPSGAHFEFGT